MVSGEEGSISVSQSWDDLADRYGRAVEIAEGAFHLGPNGIPLNLEAPPVSLRNTDFALDLGCGSGANTRAVASVCAEVTAVDSSAVQIERARACSGPGNVTYHLAPLERFVADAASERFDFVYSVFSFEYLSAVDSVFRECWRVLKAGGRFLYCDLHPLASAADIVGATLPQIADSIDYFAEGARTFVWNAGEGKAVPFVRYHRTIETLIDVALRAGFHLTDLREPLADQDSGAPYLDPSIAAQHEVWTRVPYTLCVTFTKP